MSITTLMMGHKNSGSRSALSRLFILQISLQGDTKARRRDDEKQVKMQRGRSNYLNSLCFTQLHTFYNWIYACEMNVCVHMYMCMCVRACECVCEYVCACVWLYSEGS